MDQRQRDRVMGRLRSGAVDLVVTTDVAARGLDIEQLTHVANYDVPSSPDSYLRRVGRVGRAGRQGVAITLAEPREHGMLKAIERATRHRITIESLPTVADLHARRLELTRAALREILLDGDLERFRAVVEPLADEFDVVEVALAAVRLAHERDAAGPDDDLPEPAPEAGAKGATERRRRGAGPPPQGTVRLFVGAGRTAGLRPQDLVAAIAGESRVSGRDVGAIQIGDRFSLVGARGRRRGGDRRPPGDLDQGHQADGPPRALRSWPGPGATGGGIPPPVPEHLPDDLDPDVRWVLSRMVPQPAATFAQPVRLANDAAESLPRTYVFCTEGKDGVARPPCVERARSAPGWRYRELAAGHGAHVTAPQQVADLLLELSAGGG